MTHYVCVCVCMCVCVCSCFVLCARARARVCVWVGACVWVFRVWACPRIKLLSPERACRIDGVHQLVSVPGARSFRAHGHPPPPGATPCASQLTLSHQHACLRSAPATRGHGEDTHASGTRACGACGGGSPVEIIFSDAAVCEQRRARTALCACVITNAVHELAVAQPCSHSARITKCNVMAEL